MLKYHRGERRFHRKRLFKFFCAQERRFASDEDKWVVWRARKRLHTRTMCSCSLCCTPRKTYGNSSMARTFQELRFIERFNDVE